MNPKILMTVSSIMLGLIGIAALFIPELFLNLFNAQPTNGLSVLIQLMGGLYFSLAMLNWAAKDSAIGGVYARPVSLANFVHFMIGTFTLGKYQIAGNTNVFILIMLIMYAIFSILFWWLIFKYDALKKDSL